MFVDREIPFDCNVTPDELPRESILGIPAIHQRSINNIDLILKFDFCQRYLGISCSFGLQSAS